eukprot:8577059-Pyramimonas_sp.AAC.1
MILQTREDRKTTRHRPFSNAGDCNNNHESKFFTDVVQPGVVCVPNAPVNIRKHHNKDNQTSTIIMSRVSAGARLGGRQSAWCSQRRGSLKP